MSLPNLFSLTADEAKKQAEKRLKPKWLCLKCKNEAPDIKMAVNCFIIAGEKYINEKNYGAAITCFQKVFPLARNVSMHLQEANSYYKIGYIYLCNFNDHQKSYNYIQNARLSYINNNLFKDYMNNIINFIIKYLEFSDPKDLKTISYGEKCLFDLFEDTIKNLEVIINDKTFNSYDNINYLIYTLEKHLISQEKYDNLITKLQELILNIDKYKEFKGKKILSYKGIIILIYFIKNCKENEEEEIKLILEPYFKDFREYMKENGITNEKLLINIISLIECFYQLKKIRFYEIVKLMESEYTNGILDKIKNIFLLKFDEYVVQARLNEECKVINESNYSSFLNLENDSGDSPRQITLASNRSNKVLLEEDKDKEILRDSKSTVDNLNYNKNYILQDSLKDNLKKIEKEIELNDKEVHSEKDNSDLIIQFKNFRKTSVTNEKNEEKPKTKFNLIKKNSNSSNAITDKYSKFNKNNANKKNNTSSSFKSSNINKNKNTKNSTKESYSEQANQLIKANLSKINTNVSNNVVAGNLYDNRSGNNININIEMQLNNININYKENKEENKIENNKSFTISSNNINTDKAIDNDKEIENKSNNIAIEDINITFQNTGNHKENTTKEEIINTKVTPVDNNDNNDNESEYYSLDDINNISFMKKSQSFSLRSSTPKTTVNHANNMNNNVNNNVKNNVSNIVNSDYTPNKIVSNRSFISFISAKENISTSEKLEKEVIPSLNLNFVDKSYFAKQSLSNHDAVSKEIPLEINKEINKIPANISNNNISNNNYIENENINDEYKNIRQGDNIEILKVNNKSKSMDNCLQNNNENLSSPEITKNINTKDQITLSSGVIINKLDINKLKKHKLSSSINNENINIVINKNICDERKNSNLDSPEAKCSGTAESLSPEQKLRLSKQISAQSRFTISDLPSLNVDVRYAEDISHR